VRTITGGRADEKTKGMQEDRGAADAEATLQRLRTSATADDRLSEARSGKRLDQVLSDLGETILTQQRAAAGSSNG